MEVRPGDARTPPGRGSDLRTEPRETASRSANATTLSALRSPTGRKVQRRDDEMGEREGRASQRRTAKRWTGPSRTSIRATPTQQHRDASLPRLAGILGRPCGDAMKVLQTRTPIRPTGTRGVSFDHLISAGEERRRDREVKGLCGIQIDDELESGWLVERDFARLLASENPIHNSSGDAIIFLQILIP